MPKNYSNYRTVTIQKQPTEGIHTGDETGDENMAEELKAGKGFVKKETMLIVTLIALVAGFLGGVIFSAFKTGPPRTQAPPQQTVQEQKMSTSVADNILNLEKKVAANPANFDAWVELGHAYFDTDQYQDAIMAYNKALELHPDNPDLLTDLGTMYRRAGQPEKAIASFDKSLKIAPRHEQSRFNKGVVLLYDLHDQQGALRTWEELLKINPAAMAPNGVPLQTAIDNIKKNMKEKTE